MQRQLIDGAGSALIRSAINGTSLEDELSHVLTTAFVNALAAKGAGAIGADTAPGSAINLISHAMAGCAAGAMRADSSGGCAAGSVGAIVGCVSLPSPEAMKADTASFELPKSLEPGKAIVYVVRPSGLGGLVRFNVFVDDQEAASEMGYTRSSQYIYFNVSPGEHKIYSKAENWAEAEVTANSGDVI